MAMLKRAVVLVALCSALASCTFRRPPPHHPVTPPEDPVIGGDVQSPARRPTGSLRQQPTTRLPPSRSGPAIGRDRPQGSTGLKLRHYGHRGRPGAHSNCDSSVLAGTTRGELGEAKQSASTKSASSTT